MQTTLSWFPLVLGALALAACGGEKGEGDEDDAPGGTDGVVDTEDDTELGGTGDTSFTEPLEVIAIGFEYDGGWDQEAQQLEPYLFPDLGGTYGGPIAQLGVVIVKLASAEYFQGESDDPDEYCQVLALFDGAPSDIQGETFDWDAGFGGTGENLLTWGMFEGSLTFLPDTMSSRCEELDPEVWPGGDPLALMDGMHFGLGFGPTSPYLTDLLSESYAEEWPDYQNTFMTQFVAINHPDGDGGFTFPAYDWNTGFLVETDYEQCVTIEYTNTAYSFDVCGLVQIDYDSYYYILGDTTQQPIHGYVSGGAYWFEDTPNLDLSILKDGVAQ